MDTGVMIADQTNEWTEGGMDWRRNGWNGMEWNEAGRQAGSACVSSVFSRWLPAG